MPTSTTTTTVFDTHYIKTRVTCTAVTREIERAAVEVVVGVLMPDLIFRKCGAPKSVDRRFWDTKKSPIDGLLSFNAEKYSVRCRGIWSYETTFDVRGAWVTSTRTNERTSSSSSSPLLLTAVTLAGGTLKPRDQLSWASNTQLKTERNKKLEAGKRSCCCCFGCFQPDRPFHNFRASRSGDRWILCRSGDGFWSSKIVKGTVGSYISPSSCCLIPFAFSTT